MRVADASTNCDYSIVGTGWKLVRRTTGNTHQATDRLAGTQTYGSATGPEGSASFSVNFEATVPNWNQIMLATGSCNHWMIMTKIAAIGAWYSNSYRQVLKSYDNHHEHLTRVYRRQGNPEDPWLQPSGYHSQRKSLYHENDYNANGGDGEGARNGGLNVYVRST